MGQIEINISLPYMYYESSIIDDFIEVCFW
jgi:hypothetical protein